MNERLWKQVETFDLDYPQSEYGFSTRLAKENFWTENFTKEAIAEYKKFMFLAATADVMVSPSAIVDVVWHTHLIFTQSYAAFSLALGKRVEHIPSTHNRHEFEKFKAAKERTQTLYEQTFGEQPTAIWQYEDMYHQLGLEKANIKIRTFLLIGLTGFILSIVPAFYLLRSIIVKIENPYFLFGYMALVVCTFIFLNNYNRTQITSVLQTRNKHAFIFNLTPAELVYLTTGKLWGVIHATVNRLVQIGKVEIAPDNSLKALPGEDYTDAKEHTVLETIQSYDVISYPVLIQELNAKPTFTNIPNAMDALTKYCTKSRFFVRLFIFNFIVFMLVLLPAIVRTISGLLRDKPVTFLVIVDMTCLLAIAYYLWRLTKMMGTEIIPMFYKREIIPTLPENKGIQWEYFQFGDAVLAASFAPLVIQTQSNRTSFNFGGSDSSSCGSSCGSSCSSGCGGCGGGD